MFVGLCLSGGPSWENSAELNEPQVLKADGLSRGILAMASHRMDLTVTLTNPDLRAFWRFLLLPQPFVCLRQHFCTSSKGAFSSSVVAAVTVGFMTRLSCEA